MQALVLKSLRTPLEWTDLPDRRPGLRQIRVRIAACGTCRTDLHIVDGELSDPQVPIIPGQEMAVSRSKRSLTRALHSLSARRAAMRRSSGCSAPAGSRAPRY
jgi:Alcohol dehydrogenase GroES-like domain